MVVLALSVLLAVVPPLPVLGQVPAPLAGARRLAEDLRYEEAVVEYQRYLGLPDRPAPERARALLELGFIYLVLDDQVSAEKRALEALELDPDIQPAKGAPSKQVAFLENARKSYESRPSLELVPREGELRPEAVSVRLKDPMKRASAVVLRHGISAKGPFYSARMKCDAAGVCTGYVPPPNDVSSFTAWYFIEAQDEQGAPIARAASPEAPLQLAIIQRTPWYKSPYVYAGGAALLIGAGAVFFAASAPAGR